MNEESPFSQWNEVYFGINGVIYNCAEQYMMNNVDE